MSTCREVVTAAMVRAQVLAISETAAPEEAEEALRVLQSMYDEFVTGGSFGRFCDVLISADYTAREGDRVKSNGGPFTVTLPATVTDCDSGETRAPRDLACVVLVDTSKNYIYSAALASWAIASSLTLDSTAPLSDRSLDGLASLLAVRIAGPFGGEVGTVVAAAAGRFLSNLTMKAASPRRETTAEYF